MRLTLARFAIGATAALSLFGGATFAQASSLTTSQVNSILGLLQSFGADASTISQVGLVLGANMKPSNCVDLPRTLTLGATGNDVNKLQDYLYIKGYLNTNGTSYYGFMTAQAVGKLQLALGIVSSADDTAYGIMGPRTRAAVACGGTIQPPATDSSFSATPTTGVAPLAVLFNYSAAYANTRYAIDFGDGQSGEMGYGCEAEGRCMKGWNYSHTYTTQGTYTAKLIQNYCAGACDFNANKVVGTATITVASQTSGTPTTFSATPTTGAAPLTVTFVAPPSPGGDYVSFGDGADGCSVPGVTNDGMTGCSVPPNKPFTHTYTKPGVYKAMVSRLLPSTVLGTATITVTGEKGGPTGSVDGGAVTAKNGTFTVSGTSKGVANGVIVFVSTYNYGSVDYGVLNGQIGKDGIYKTVTPVSSDGDWHAQFVWNVPNTTTFYVYVFDKDYTTLYGNEVHSNIANGQIVVNAPVQATFCPSTAVAQRGLNNQQFQCTCPANFTVKQIWGTTYFTDDSDICTAGAFMGQLNPTSGGPLYYTILPGQSSYPGSIKNSINSGNWDNWYGSFMISGPKG